MESMMLVMKKGKRPIVDCKLPKLCFALTWEFALDVDSNLQWKQKSSDEPFSGTSGFLSRGKRRGGRRIGRAWREPNSRACELLGSLLLRLGLAWRTESEERRAKS